MLIMKPQTLLIAFLISAVPLMEDSFALSKVDGGYGANIDIYSDTPAVSIGAADTVNTILEKMKEMTHTPDEIKVLGKDIQPSVYFICTATNEDKKLDQETLEELKKKDSKYKGKNPLLVLSYDLLEAGESHSLSHGKRK